MFTQGFCIQNGFVKVGLGGTVMTRGCIPHLSLFFFFFCTALCVAVNKVSQK